MALLGVKDGQFYVWRNLLSKGERMPDAQRRALVAALMETVPKELQPQELILKELREINDKLDRPERSRPPKPIGVVPVQ